ncbi:Peptidoglycan/xylan/chitin deacetylase, PgdA/CDA1 family [Enhydrobacter aerosaccus]|uniref:Chitooligosaccharide deacetylase n=1 Tax=Enhydrobacter aerosaccus TaxID=225324 RepID=A0A1T4K561_9HYPH|nr:polysaccharide deacetylase family protein [Enhydrobacter aerosaccus]SJZ37473.1 Peptidoglycan/xylan/chitin deacetylase, PgdA/CDA1 family [Enhydrobacter aerosaccus]
MTDLPNSRDLVGYADAQPAWKLPNGAALAVSLVINFEEGAELAVSDGDPASERVSEIVSVVPPGRWDQGTEQIFAYGMRAGIWRMLEALRRHDRKITFYMCGRAVQRVPQIARRIVDAGHEAACHGWLWRPHADYDTPEAEQHDLQRCVDVIEAATGQQPQGFFCRGSESPWTRPLLRRLGFSYTSNGFDDDLPYWDATEPADPLLVLPYALDSNDMKFFHPNGFVGADEMVAYVRDAIDVLLAEGEAGHPKLLNIGFHLRIAGRPGRFAAFQRVLALLDSYGDRLWVARRIDIARSWQSQFPAATTGR